MGKEKTGRRTIRSRVDGQRRARNPKVQQLQHPAFEQRVVRAGRGLEQRVAEYWDRVRLGLQGLAEGGEQVRLFL